MSTLFTLNTPCVGICSTVYGDDICRGCKRSCQEVIDWNAYSNEVQIAIFERLEQGQKQIMADKVEILDSAILEAILIEHQIRYRAVSDPLCWAFHLLRVRPNNLMNLDGTGIEVKPVYAGYSLKALFTLIDEELLKLSSNNMFTSSRA